MPEELITEVADVATEPPQSEPPPSDREAGDQDMGGVDVLSDEEIVLTPPLEPVTEPVIEPVFGMPPIQETTLAAPLEIVAEELALIRQQVNESARALGEAFDEKLAYDRHKEQQIDSLHSELQEHKRGLLARATRPLFKGLIRLHDNLGRMAEDLTRESPEKLTSEYFCGILEGFQDDVEIVLEDNGVSPFLEPCERFEPRRQTSRRTIKTDDEDRIGMIAHRARPGFEQEETLLQKERVDVFVRARPMPEGRSEPGIEEAIAESQGARGNE